MAWAIGAYDARGRFALRGEGETRRAAELAFRRNRAATRDYSLRVAWYESAGPPGAIVIIERDLFRDAKRKLIEPPD